MSSLDKDAKKVEKKAKKKAKKEDREKCKEAKRQADDAALHSLIELRQNQSSMRMEDKPDFVT